MIGTELPPYLARLDDKQRVAALDIVGPVVIFAGAGAGKSAVLAARVAHLLDKGVAPDRILCVTFTNKAAEEMRSRIESYSGCSLTSMPIGTYHSICARILREYGSAIGINSDYTVYDDGQSKFIFRQATNDAGMLVDGAKELHAELDRFKAQTLDLDGWCDVLAAELGQFQADKFRELYSCYQVRLRNRNALDFGDLTRELYRLLESSPDVRSELSGRLQYILVDEYQDTSMIESSILKLLSSTHGNLCVVGDVRQAIFAWRGSDYRLMLNFENEYPGAKVHLLDANYRSAKAIVEASEKLIAGSAISSGYRSIPARTTEGGVDIIRSISDEVEADTIARFLEETVSAGLIKYGDVAILSRIRSTTRTLEETLEERGIPFVAPGKDITASPEMQCALAYLRLILDSSNANARQQLDWFRDDKTGGDVHQKTQQFAGMHACGVTLQGLVESVIDNVRAELDIAPKSVGAKSLYELRKLAMQYQGLSNNMLPAFLNQFAISSVNKNAVQIMTIHMSKGLQFPVVFVVGMEEDILPCWHATGDTNAMEEERRLCYVAMTRAKGWLCLSFCDSRKVNGRHRKLKVSRFVSPLSQSTCRGTTALD